MTTNRTRAEQVVEAFRRMDPDGPSLVDRIEQALEEAVRDALKKREEESMDSTTGYLNDAEKRGTLAGLEMAARLCDASGNGSCPECASDIRAKAKEVSDER